EQRTRVYFIVKHLLAKRVIIRFFQIFISLQCTETCTNRTGPLGCLRLFSFRSNRRPRRATVPAPVAQSKRFPRTAQLALDACGAVRGRRTLASSCSDFSNREERRDFVS